MDKKSWKALAAYRQAEVGRLTDSVTDLLKANIKLRAALSPFANAKVDSRACCDEDRADWFLYALHPTDKNFHPVLFSGGENLTVADLREARAVLYG